MDKITLLAAAILMLGATANASEVNRISDGTAKARFDIEQPIEFTERGIAFFVFANGEFDFNTESSTHVEIYNKIGRRNYNYNSGVTIEHDANGRVRRIGNVFVNYDNIGRIKRIGTIYMTYKSLWLTQVGGLKITYNRWGQISSMFGNVKENLTQNYNFNDGCGTGFANSHSHQTNTSNDHQYFRGNGKR